MFACFVPERLIIPEQVSPSTGGTIPYFLNFWRPPSLIQRVVQAGDKTVCILTASTPLFRSAVSISREITLVAGHPEYVGVILTHKTLSSQCALRTMPRSTTETAGISGSGISSSHCHICSRLGEETVCLSIIATMTHQDRHAEDVALSSELAPWPRSEFQTCHLIALACFLEQSVWKEKKLP